MWARLFFGAWMTLPFALKLAGVRGLVPNMPLMHGVRACFMVAATAFFFWALHYLPIADTLAIFFVQPLIVTMLSPLVLGETVGVRRWLAVIVGFIGTLIIIRPGLQELKGAGLLDANLPPGFDIPMPKSGEELAPDEEPLDGTEEQIPLEMHLPEQAEPAGPGTN